MKKEIFYRPPWTCGKYNAEKHVAIMFNLLSRMNYFFEEESADVVGMVLAAGRNGKVSVDEVSDKLMITTSSIETFLAELCSCHLLSKEAPTAEMIAEYRKECIGLASPPMMGAHVAELTEKGIQSASHAYADAINMEGVIADVTFELTYRCQEQCIHCYNPGATRNDSERSGRSDLEELTFDDYKHIIDDLCAHGLVSAGITGGDPFMHPFAWEIIDYLFQHDVATTIMTNSIGLVGKEGKLADYFPYLVQCSIYSGEAEVHDKITRTKGSWQRTIGVMDRLHELGVPLDVGCPLMQTNLKSYFSVKPYNRKYGSSKSFDVQLTDSIDGDKCVSHHLRLLPEQLSVVLLDEDVMQHIDPSKAYNDSLHEKSHLNGPPCGAGINTLCISPNGDVVPCVAFRKVLGNVRQKSIGEIAMKNDFIKQWRKTTAADYGECFTHEYCDCCMLFCPGNNFNDKSEYLNGGENNCYYAKERYNAYMRLRVGEDALRGKTIAERINELSVYEEHLQRENTDKGHMGNPVISQ